MSSDDMDSDPPTPTSPISPALPAPRQFHWSSKLRAQVSSALDNTDRILLPQEALEGMLATGEDMPNPLIFEIVNFQTRRRCFAGVKEFTADPGLVNLPPWMGESLGVADGADTVSLRTVTLPKAKYVKLQPLETDYLEISDIRAELEGVLRGKYTTLTAGEVLPVLALSSKTRSRRVFPFMISEVVPGYEGGVSVTDTDINVDIVPLDDAMAEEAVRLKFSVGGSGDGSEGVELVWGGAASPASGEAVTRRDENEVEDHRYRYYRVKTRTGNWRYYIFELQIHQGDADIFIDLDSPQPTTLDHTWFNVDPGSKTVHLDVSSPPYLADLPSSPNSTPDALPPFIYIGVKGYAPSTRFSIVVQSLTNPVSASEQPTDPTAKANDVEPPGPDYQRCSNCSSWVPSRTLAMHEAFCVRNNALCGVCRRVMKKEELKEHWHCEECGKAGTLSEKAKHMSSLHTPTTCLCGLPLLLPSISQHRHTECPERTILCKFCHLRIRAGPVVGFNGETEHEAECGARTVPCVKCGKNVRLRDVGPHMKVHDMERRRRPAPYTLCSNVNCSNAESPQSRNILRLCPQCFRPFWNPINDPQNKKLISSIVQTYHKQLTKGCGYGDWDANQYCCTSSDPTHKEPLDPTAAAVMSLDLVKRSALFEKVSPPRMYICVKEPAVANRRKLARDILAPMGWREVFCVDALHKCGDDVGKAVDFLRTNYPTVEEEVGR